MKKKLDALTKAKLIYSGELIIIAIIFLVVAVLKFTGVIPYDSTRHLVFNWITLFGGTWVIIDFFWGLLSKKRRPKISLLDKALHLPAGIYMVAFDLYCIITKPTDPMIYRLGFPIAISYLCLCYIFEGIYHFYHPIPGILDAIVEVDEEEKPEESSLEEQPENIPEEEKDNEEK